MAVGRSGAVLIDSGNGALVAGGNGTAEPDAAYYDPDTGAFTVAGNFLIERHDVPAVALEDGTVLFAGGTDGSGKALASAELFHPGPGRTAFSLYAPAQVVTVNSGTGATFKIEAEPAPSFSGSIALSCTGNPSLQCVFDPSSIIVTGASTLTVTGFAQVPNGLNRFMVTGTAGGTSFSMPLDIVTQPPPGPMVVFTPPSLTFAPVTVGAASAAQAVILTNAGTGSMTVRSITGPGNFSADALNCVGELLPPGYGCYIGVQFHPVKAGEDHGELVIQDDAPGSPQTVALSGTGLADPAPAATIAPAGLNFPSQPVQTISAWQTVTLASNGKGALLIGGVSLHAVQFEMQNNCPTVLPPGQKCSIQVYFFPISTGTFYGNLQIRDNAAATPVTVALSVKACRTHRCRRW